MGKRIQAELQNLLLLLYWTEIHEGSNLKNKDELKRAWEFCCYVWIRSCPSRFPSKRPLRDTTYVRRIFKGHHVNKTHLGMQLLKGPILIPKQGKASHDIHTYICNSLFKPRCHVYQIVTSVLAATYQVVEFVLSQCHSCIKLVWTCSSSIWKKGGISSFSIQFFLRKSTFTDNILYPPLHCLLLIIHL